MKLTTLKMVVAAAALSVSLVACHSNPTAATAVRTASVAATVQVPAVPTAPITITTNDPQSNVQVTLDVKTLQQIAQLVGGAAQIKMTDMAPVDYKTLPASEQALVNHDSKSLATLVFDIQPSSSVSAIAALRTFPVLAQTTSGSTFTFKIKNDTGKRCTPGTVDLLEIFGSSSGLLSSAVVIDNDIPLQNISGTAEQVLIQVKHFIFCFECPRVTPTGGIGE